MVATKMDNPRELFLHELGDILFAEKLLVKTLPKLQREASDEELKNGFSRHVEETRQQVKNLEQAFKQLGQKVKAERCPGMEGIVAEHDQFMSEEKPSADVRDAFLVGATTRTEHYEIATYTGLVTMAKAMGESEAARLLDENLKQEKAMLKEAETISKRLAKESAKREKEGARSDGAATPSPRRGQTRRGTSGQTRRGTSRSRA